MHLAGGWEAGCVLVAESAALRVLASRVQLGHGAAALMTAVVRHSWTTTMQQSSLQQPKRH